MKILDRRKPDVKFGTLEPGVVFLHKGTYYLRLQYLPVGCHVQMNAVSLVSGVITTIPTDAMVKPIDGEFVVKKVNA